MTVVETGAESKTGPLQHRARTGQMIHHRHSRGEIPEAVIAGARFARKPQNHFLPRFRRDNDMRSRRTEERQRENQDTEGILSGV